MRHRRDEPEYEWEVVGHLIERSVYDLFDALVKSPRSIVYVVQ
jgi:hypothetical protein